MATTSDVLASGPGWRVDDVRCTAGPDDRPFEERHADTCIAAVLGGSFQYRTPHGRTTLVPGALLLGNAGDCFECGHAHTSGDRCIAFHFAPAVMETVAAVVPGVRKAAFAAPRLPPLPPLVPLLAAAEAATEPAELEELGLALAGTVVSALAATLPSVRTPSRRDERRVAEALRQIEAASDDAVSLAELAASAAMSRYHFLRVFRDLVGLTPYQFVLRARLHRAAVQLRQSREAISTIAFDCGFGDLATFNRRFRRIVGTSPGLYRARYSGARENRA
jgi:AraC-like DNA-binding protein